MKTTKNTRGFTLIEMLLALVVLALILKALILLTLSFTSAFTVLRQNHIGYSILSHASDFLSAELSTAYPYAIQINQEKSSIRYQKILYHGSVYIQKTKQGLTFILPDHKRMDARFFMNVAAIVFKSQPTAIHAVNINSQENSFELNSGEETGLKHSQWAEAYILSSEYSMDFSPDTQTLVRKSIGSKRASAVPALISHLTNCKFNWYSDYKTLNINLVQRIDTKNDYTFVQQIFLLQ